MRFTKRLPVGSQDAVVIKVVIDRSAPWLRLPRLQFSIKTEAR